MKFSFRNSFKKIAIYFDANNNKTFQFKKIYLNFFFYCITSYNFEISFFSLLFRYMKNQLNMYFIR